jgi:lipoprotein NlpD
VRRTDPSKICQFSFTSCLVCIFLLEGCGNSNLAPLISRHTLVEELQVFSDGQIVSDPTSRSTHYVVRKGDTLHSIAWRYAIPYQDLVKWNKIASPDLINIGSKLRLTAHTRQNQPILSGNVKNGEQGNTASPKGVTWGWPSAHRRFSRSQLGSGRGLSIKGVIGESVKAAASGIVVYSGNGLRGYGELLIIQHNENFLSAYGHNHRRLVSEGDFVTLGGKIATMGKTESKDVKLYFEIRQRGKPVNALNYLPGK